MSSLSRIVFTSPREVALVDDGHQQPSPLGREEIGGRTVATLVSPGTELARLQGLGHDHEGYPYFPGYAAVFEVDEAGPASGAAPGDLYLCLGRHQSRQRVDRGEAVKLPGGLEVQTALFARLMAIGMVTLITTKARPPERVLVLGLGIVGHLAAKVFAAAGYDTYAWDPDEDRRRLLDRSAVTTLATPAAESSLNGSVALALECSGHERAALDGVRAVQRGGEVVLVGVTWEPRTSITASELLAAIFSGYASVRSGWEWEVPLTHEEFRPPSTFELLAGAVRWLADGRIDLDGVYSTATPSEAPAAYAEMLSRKRSGLAVIFDWSAGPA
jgi:threonine dehydrogenase-like Zn-dependent dehydrogenase